MDLDRETLIVLGLEAAGIVTVLIGVVEAYMGETTAATALIVAGGVALGLASILWPRAIRKRRSG